jgi:hypothetical protein
MAFWAVTAGSIEIPVAPLAHLGTRLASIFLRGKTRMAQEQANKDRAPLGSAPGYGDVTEGVVGPQGPGGSGAAPQDQQEQGQTATPERGKAGGAGGEQSQGGGEAGSDEAAPTDAPLYKEELLPEEKGTSLDEGGAG